MNVQLLFRCNERREQAHTSTQKVGGVKLSPVYPMEEHPAYELQKSFYAWTPGGQVDFSTINEAALAQFEIGTDYLITIQRADEVYPDAYKVSEATA